MSAQFPPLKLSPVRFETPLRELPGPVVVESEDGTITVVEVLGTEGKIRLSRADRTDPTYLYGRSLQSDLGEIAVLELKSRAVRAFALPPGAMQVRHRSRLLLLSALGALAAVCLMVVVAVVPIAGALKAFLIMLLLVLAGGGPIIFTRLNPPTKQAYRTTDGTYPLDRLLDARPALAAAVSMVDDVKARYGALLSDLCYRLEFPALFDPADDAAYRLTTALIRWDTRQEGQLDSSELSALAADVRIAFDAATSHAETVGQRHYPPAARPEAERGLKAARLAEGAATAGERAAALRQVAVILESLALYYLPSPIEATRMLEGHRVLALPGRLTPSSGPDAE